MQYKLSVSVQASSSTRVWSEVTIDEGDVRNWCLENSFDYDKLSYDLRWILHRTLAEICTAKDLLLRQLISKEDYAERIKQTDAMLAKVLDE